MAEAESARYVDEVRNKNLEHALMMNRLIHREYLAHTLAYVNLVDGTTMKIPGMNGKMVDAIVHKIETGNDSLVGYVFEINDPQGPPRIEIAFRGTHNMSSAHMDLECGGAGAVSYFNAREGIVSQVNAIVEHLVVKSGGRVILGVSGHSLGGALAQRCMVDIACSMVQNDGDARISNKPANVSKISAVYAKPIINLANKSGLERETREHINIHNIFKLELGVFNSTGVDDESYNKAHYFSEYLQNSFYGYNKKKAFSITADYCLNSRDGVQQTGRRNIFANCPFTNLNLFKFNPPRNWYKQLATGAAVASLAAVALGPIGTFLVGLGAYKGSGTFVSHTAKHATLEDYNLVLHSKVFEIYTNKKSYNGARDLLGCSKIREQLLDRKSSLINNHASEMLTAWLHYFTSKACTYRKVIEIDKLVEEKVATIKAATQELRMKLAVNIGG